MIKKILLYIWQAPQNILGLLFLLFIRGEERHTLAGVSFYFLDSFPGGISLGQYIIYGEKWEKGVRHEFGHCLQSRMLGPLYLLVVGLPSLLHAAFCKCKNHSYYDVYPENWADKLGKVKR